jgi:predicted transposase YbfD/YdcC
LSKKTVAAIIKSKNEYIIGVKGNQKKLYEKLKETTMNIKEATSLSITIEKNKGRLETRKVFVFDKPTGILKDWLGLQSLLRVDREVNGIKRSYTETSYYISSLSMDAKKFNEGIRAHWGIENKLHWVKDVTFQEDNSKIRSGYAPENMSILRNITINILRKNGYKNLKQATRLLANNISKITEMLE